MRKYLELFTNGFDDTLAEKIKPENRPYIGYSPSEGLVFTVIPKPVVYDPYVTFTAEEDNSSIGLEKLSTYQTLEYSTDTTTWNTFDTTTNISLNNGDKVYVRGVLSAGNEFGNNYTQFKMSGKIAASGNCNAIWNYQDLNASLKVRCGLCMFSGCASLTTAPELPATMLTEGCYCEMFHGCTSLTTAPELRATMLARGCYSNMFNGCTKLNHITCLATDISAEYCTINWVKGVSSTGTFVKYPSMNRWSTGTSGIPSGWTVVDAEL